MTLQGVLQSRFSDWVTWLDRFGYAVKPAFRIPTNPRAQAFSPRASRNPALGHPEVVIDVTEIWVPGTDPDGLGAEGQGCYLERAIWHAQIAPGAVGAERYEIHRRKPAPFKVHTHPLGHRNDVREPAAWPLPLKSWINHVEVLAMQSVGVQ